MRAVVKRWAEEVQKSSADLSEARRRVLSALERANREYTADPEGYDARMAAYQASRPPLTEAQAAARKRVLARLQRIIDADRAKESAS